MWLNIIIFIQEGQIEIIHLGVYRCVDDDVRLYIYPTGCRLSLVEFDKCTKFNS